MNCWRDFIETNIFAYARAETDRKLTIRLFESFNDTIIVSAQIFDTFGSLLKYNDYKIFDTVLIMSEDSIVMPITFESVRKACSIKHYTYSNLIGVT